MELVLNTLRSLSYVVVEPSLLIMLAILGLLFYFKNRKVATMQKIIIGEELTSPLELTLSQIVLGILAGILGSIIFTLLGVTFTDTSGIQLLFVLSILLMFVKPRFICFSYSGAILGAIGLIVSYIYKLLGSTNTFLDIDIMSLMTFVGVMHIVEALLVMFDGDRGSLPVFTNKNNNICGGYALNRYWMLPIVIFIAYSMSGNSDIASGSVATPGWWPIMRSDYMSTLLATSVLGAMPLFGMVGYSSITFSRSKREKKVSSGLFILAFGVFLTLAAQLCKFGIVAEICVIVLAPVGHEFMLYMQRKKEEKRDVLFISDESGIAILEVIPYSELYELGIRAGDKIIKVNGDKVISEKDIYEKAKRINDNLKLDILLRNGIEKSIELKNKDERGLRALLVPKSVNKENVVPLNQDKFSEVLDEARNKTE